MVAGLRASAPELSPNAKDVRALLAGLPAATVQTPAAGALMEGLAGGEMEKGQDELLAEAVRWALESEPGIGVKRLVAGLRASAPELSPNAKDVRAVLAGLPAALRTPGAASVTVIAALSPDGPLSSLPDELWQHILVLLLTDPPSESVESSHERSLISLRALGRMAACSRKMRSLIKASPSLYRMYR